MTEWSDQLAQLVRARGAELSRYGYLLCGDATEGADLFHPSQSRSGPYEGAGPAGTAHPAVSSNASSSATVWRRRIRRVVSPSIRTSGISGRELYVEDMLAP